MHSAKTFLQYILSLCILTDPCDYYCHSKPMKLILSSPLQEKTTKRKSSFLGFTQEVKKKLLNGHHEKGKFIPCMCSPPTPANRAVHNKTPWTLSLSKSSVPDTVSLVAFSRNTESIFTHLGMNHMLLAIYHPCLEFFCSYRHTVKFSGQIKAVREQHRLILQTGNGTISLIEKHSQ